MMVALPITSGLHHHHQQLQLHLHRVNESWTMTTTLPDDDTGSGSEVDYDDCSVELSGPWNYNSTGWMVLGYLQIGYVPTISVAGIVGNLLSMIVFLRTNLRARSSSYYLAALAAADTTFLVQLLVVYLTYLDLDLYNRNGGCQALVYLSSVTTFLSVWLVVGFTTERFIAIQYPLQRPKVCTVTRAKRTIVGLTSLALVTNSYLLFTAVAIEDDEGRIVCDVYPEFHRAFLVINVLDMLATLVLPVSLIVVMNSIMAVQLLRFSRSQRRAAEEEQAATAAMVAYRCRPLSETHRNDDDGRRPRSSSGGNRSRSSSDQSHTLPNKNNNNNNNNNTSVSTTTGGHVVRHKSINVISTNYYSYGGRWERTVTTSSSSSSSRTPMTSRTTLSQRAQYNITKMLLLISTAFVCLNLPSYVMRLHNYYYRNCVTEATYLMQQYTMLLFYTNFSINFLLYSAYGISFRKALCEYARRNLGS